MLKAQVVEVRGRRFYVCQYTGALVTQRFFVPTGRLRRGKDGCFATLPILLRALFEDEGNQATPRYARTKTLLEDYYNQPNIPMQPALDVQRVPLSAQQLADYLVELDKGQAWLHVKKGQKIDEHVTRARGVRKRGKVWDEEDEEEEVELSNSEEKHAPSPPPPLEFPSFPDGFL